MKGYRRGYRPPGAITRASCKRAMMARVPQPPKAKGNRGITKGMARRMMPQVRGITAKQVATQVGERLRRAGVRIGNKPVQLPPGANIDNYQAIMRGAGYAIRKEDLRKMQR